MFDGQVSTGCGVATSEVGPFYCPPDAPSTSTWGSSTSCMSRLGAQGGPFAQAYVLGHEYGHHIQNLTGILDRVQGDRPGPQSAAVRSELQADCYAGVWAANAVRTGVLEQVTRGGHRARASTPRRQSATTESSRRTQGQVNPETWTHGSSEQRQRWFTTGLRARIRAPATRSTGRCSD